MVYTVIYTTGPQNLQAADERISFGRPVLRLWRANRYPSLEAEGDLCAAYV